MKSTNFIPLSVPVIKGNEWKYVKECLDTGWVSYVGSYVNRFEKAFAEYVGAKYAVAVASGTAGLHLALLSCGVTEKDEVIVPTLTFIAPVNTVRYCRAYPVFMDADERTLCIDPEKLSDFFKKECYRRKDGYTYNKSSKRRIKAIMPVHIFGHPAEMDAIIGIAENYNVCIIEDATESLGSEYKGKKTGLFSKAACFSFNGNKIITTGGGGMVVTDDRRLADYIKHLSTQAKNHPIEYDHDEIGFNYRMPNMQAALGFGQLENIREYVGIKRKNACLYRDLFANASNVEFLWEQEHVKSNFWFYTIKVPVKFKNKLMQYLIQSDIQSRPLWKLIHGLKMYKDFQTYSIENAPRLYNTCLNIPCSVNLKKEEIEFVARKIHDFFVN